MKIKTEGYKSVRGALHAINFITTANAKGIFRDNYWQPVKKIVDDLRGLGWVNFWGWQFTEYEHNPQGEVVGKSWVGPVEIEIWDGISPRRVTRWLNIRASFLDKNTESYDLVAYVS